MFEYIKMILQKVSFDKNLFEKELQKGINQLLPNEIRRLKIWCYQQFGQIYQQILNKCFRRILIAKA